MQTVFCPCCSYPLLCHTRAGQLYWLCLHCRQEFAYGFSVHSVSQETCAVVPQTPSPPSVPSPDAEKVLSALIQQLHQPLELAEILSLAVTKLRSFMQTDRVLILQCFPDRSNLIIAEARSSSYAPMQGWTLHDPLFQSDHSPISFQQGQVHAIHNFTQLDEAQIQFRLTFQIKAELIAPILQQDWVWGFLIAHQCATSRHWQTVEMEHLKVVAQQLSVAIHRAERYQQVQGRNAELISQVQEQASQRQQAMAFEAIVKQLTHRLCLLSESEPTLQTVLQALAQELSLPGCAASLHGPSPLATQVFQPIPTAPLLGGDPEPNWSEWAMVVSPWLRDRPDCQFCWLKGSEESQPQPTRSTLLVCPLQTAQQSFGLLWLWRPEGDSFGELETHFIHQVAEQSAIALQRIRGQQQQIAEEIQLIEDVLTLQKLEQGQWPILRDAIPLQTWLTHRIHLWQSTPYFPCPTLDLQWSLEYPYLVCDRLALQRILEEILTQVCRGIAPDQPLTLGIYNDPSRFRLTLTLPIQGVSSNIDPSTGSNASPNSGPDASPNTSPPIHSDASSGLTAELQHRLSALEHPTSHNQTHLSDFQWINTTNPETAHGKTVSPSLAQVNVAIALRVIHALLDSLEGQVEIQSHPDALRLVLTLPQPISSPEREMLMGYVAYYLSRGKSVISPHAGALPFQGEVYYYWGYDRAFLHFWFQLEQRPDFPELYLDNDVICFRDFTQGHYSVHECARCHLPIPTPTGRAYSLPSCNLCHEKAGWSSLHHWVKGVASLSVIIIGSFQADSQSRSYQHWFHQNRLSIHCFPNLEAIEWQQVNEPIDLILVQATEAHGALSEQFQILKASQPQLDRAVLVFLSPQAAHSQPWLERSMHLEDYLLTPLGGEYLVEYWRSLETSDRQRVLSDETSPHWLPL